MALHTASMPQVAQDGERPLIVTPGTPAQVEPTASAISRVPACSLSEERPLILRAFARRVRALRESLGLSTDELVDALGPHLLSTADRVSARLGYRRAGRAPDASR